MFKTLARQTTKLTPPIISQAHDTWRFLCASMKPRKVGGFLFGSSGRIGKTIQAVSMFGEPSINRKARCLWLN